ncbi:hypothetical protein [Exilibacterium tricleocarpae]|uniref:hypothetical protein n=1 Tax=Exilibacterium tricleocarpae TaxID=2591008 RepID=UPI0015D24613|nr:hypothetical protein [Exilibacterium tricleocarpae]
MDKFDRIRHSTVSLKCTSVPFLCPHRQCVQSPAVLFELPGLWLAGDELQSPTLLLNVRENLGNGLLNRESGFYVRVLRAQPIDENRNNDSFQ